MWGSLTSSEWATLLSPSFVSTLGQAVPSPGWNTSGSNMLLQTSPTNAAAVQKECFAHSTPPSTVGTDCKARCSTLCAWPQLPTANCAAQRAARYKPSHISADGKGQWGLKWSTKRELWWMGWWEALSLHHAIKSFQDLGRQRCVRERTGLK